MNKKTTAIALFLMCSIWTFGQQIPDRKEVLNKMVIANKYFMEKYSDVTKPSITDRERPSNIWTRGVYYEGLMVLHSIYPKAEYYDYALTWAEFHKWGFRNGNTSRNADDQCCGQTYIDLYNIEPNPARIKNIKICMDMVVNTPQNDDWWWIDAMQMAMPVFAKLAVVYNDNRYYEKMYEMYMYTKTKHGDKGLYNTVDGLWWRDKDFDPPYKEPNGEDCYWSRGNGWVLAALAKVLDIMPKNAPHRDEYLLTYKEMCTALIKVQRADGFWNPSLHDPTNFGSKETTGTSLFTYGIAWGLNNNVLDKKIYLPVVVKAWNALATESVQESGFLGYVQGTGKEPKDGQPVTVDHIPNFEDLDWDVFYWQARKYIN